MPGPPGPPGPPGGDKRQGLRTSVRVLSVLLLFVGIFFTISCAILMGMIATMVAAQTDPSIWTYDFSFYSLFQNLWPFPDWATIAFLLDNIGLIIAASILVSAVYCAKPDGVEASPQGLFYFVIYNVFSSTSQCLVAVFAMASHLYYNEMPNRAYGIQHTVDIMNDRHSYLNRLYSGICWLVISLIIYCCLLGCTAPVYLYYNSFRPMAVYRQQERPRTPQDA